MKNRLAGFTLIELLVVVLVVGVLSGVVVAVIDPVQQQSKAREAGVLASLDKLALAAQAHTAARGVAPTEQEFLAIAEKVTPLNGTECVETSFAVNQNCRFSVVGVTLPQMCAANLWTGDSEDGNQCYFFYYRDSGWNPERFRVFVRSWGLTDRTFVMDSTVPDMYHCVGNDIGADIDVDLSSAAFCEKWDN